MNKVFLLLLSWTLLVQSAFAVQDEVFCFEKYGRDFNVDADVLRAISWVESRHDTDAINENISSIDYGHMQINSYWIDQLLGDQYANINDPCFCTAIGAFILSDCMSRYGVNEDALSCYNSGKSLDHLTSDSKKRVERYIALVHKKYLELKQSATARE